MDPKLRVGTLVSMTWIKDLILKVVSCLLCCRLISVRPAIHFSYFAFRGYFANIFAKHTVKYKTLTIHFSYFMRILCFINAAKKETTKSFDFLHECRPWCKMLRNAKSENRGEKCKKVTQNTPLNTFHFSHFAIVFAYLVISV